VSGGEDATWRGAWPRPAGGAMTVYLPTAARPRRAWVARSVLSRSGRRRVIDAQDPAGSRRGREGREVRGTCGRPRKE
jgi:hypothetical protein